MSRLIFMGCCVWLLGCTGNNRTAILPTDAEARRIAEATHFELIKVTAPNRQQSRK
jgi:hypothetical protein